MSTFLFNYFNIQAYNIFLIYYLSVIFLPRIPLVHIEQYSIRSEYLKFSKKKAIISSCKIWNAIKLYMPWILFYFMHSLTKRNEYDLGVDILNKIHLYIIN